MRRMPASGLSDFAGIEAAQFEIQAIVLTFNFMPHQFVKSPRRPVFLRLVSQGSNSLYSEEPPT